MPIDRWMDKEVVVHLYKGILLNHIKEHIWISSGKVDEPRACYSEWSESEREKQISYINTYIWNLEKWCWWTYSRGRNKDSEHRLTDTAGEKEGGMDWESSIEIYTLPRIK